MTVKPENLMTTTWRCQECPASGTVRISKHENGGVFLQRLIDLHKLSSPYCRIRKIDLGAVQFPNPPIIDSFSRGDSKPLGPNWELVGKSRRP